MHTLKTVLNKSASSQQEPEGTFHRFSLAYSARGLVCEGIFPPIEYTVKFDVSTATQFRFGSIIQASQIVSDHAEAFAKDQKGRFTVSKTRSHKSLHSNVFSSSPAYLSSLLFLQPTQNRVIGIARNLQTSSDDSATSQKEAKGIL